MLWPEPPEVNDKATLDHANFGELWRTLANFEGPVTAREISLMQSLQFGLDEGKPHDVDMMAEAFRKGFPSIA